MCKTICYFVFLMLLCGFFLGCANTIRGVSEGVSNDAKNNWDTIKKWDANFEKNWW